MLYAPGDTVIVRPEEMCELAGKMVVIRDISLEQYRICDFSDRMRWTDGMFLGRADLNADFDPAPQAEFEAFLANAYNRCCCDRKDS